MNNKRKNSFLTSFVSAVALINLGCLPSKAAAFSLHHRAKFHVNRKILIRLHVNDDSNSPDEPTSRRRKGRRRDGNYSTILNDDVSSDLQKSPIYFVLKPVPILFGYQLPLIYLVANAVAISILPTVTWILLTILFVVYLSLGNAVINGGDMVSSNQDMSSTEYNEEDETTNLVLPFAAFVGAILSAALLSPQGLVVENEESLTILRSSFIVTSLGVGLAMLFTETKEIQNEEQLLDRKEEQEMLVRDERRRMNQWDDELGVKSIEDEDG